MFSTEFLRSQQKTLQLLNTRSFLFSSAAFDSDPFKGGSSWIPSVSLICEGNIDICVYPLGRTNMKFLFIFILCLCFVLNMVQGQLQIDGDELVLMTGDHIRMRKVRSTDGHE
ncbi:hypothetical protein Ddc_05080 [Ditylenchus destructor]|nr:hypothetical protein Ddc_05080 [Ditylenchus destructor]